MTQPPRKLSPLAAKLAAQGKGPRSAGMKSHGGLAQKSIGRLSMAGSASLNGVVAHRPDAAPAPDPAHKRQQFSIRPGEGGDDA